MTSHPYESDGHEQFERRQLARDRDHSTALQIAESDARHIVTDLVDAGIVAPNPETQQFRHRPTGEVFRSCICLAYFHRGWLAGVDG
ncbi:hypothetical protein [Haloarchaeobius sp. DFWS5]|uniref:hypothetical protein n=1 Tax=Haloarchaeobius sp. DFWS5 TaxID=3446114 RepID=UPI003EB93D47